jgi:hypothetical protein
MSFLALDPNFILLFILFMCVFNYNGAGTAVEDIGAAAVAVKAGRKREGGGGKAANGDGDGDGDCSGIIKG